MSDSFEQVISKVFSFLAQTNINNAIDLHYLHCIGPLSCVGCVFSLIKLFLAIEGSLFSMCFSSPVAKLVWALG